MDAHHGSADRYTYSIMDLTGTGGAFGGGGGMLKDLSHLSTDQKKSSATAGAGGHGAVRVIWGPNRAFPSTNTGDVPTITASCKPPPDTTNNPPSQPAGSLRFATRSWNTPGTYEWIAPPGVTTISYVVVGGGAAMVRMLFRY